MKTFLFYDLETSGLNCSFDQILTFAAIRTDGNLNEIGRDTVTVSLRDDIVPSPGAFITHRLSVEELSQGISEYDAVMKIHGIFNCPGTVSLGYNTLGFDDEFLRFAFYRNLLDPYTHQYAANCSRMDVLPITTLYRIFKPELLNWPIKDEKNSLKLELISQENHLVSSGRAHDAMTDVEATLELARRLVQEKDMWNYCLDFFDKQKDRARIEKITKSLSVGTESFRLALMVSPAFGASCMYLAPVLNIGYSEAYSGQGLWLRLDKPIFPDMQKPDALNIHDDKDRLFVIRKRFGDAEIILPPLERFWARMTEAQKLIYRDNVAVMRTHADAFKKLVAYHKAFEYPFISDLDSDAALYQSGFFTNKEKRQMLQFHNCKDKDKYSWVEQISSERVRGLAERILFRNLKPRQYPESIRKKRREYINRVLSSSEKDSIKGFRGTDRKLDADTALAEIKTLELQEGLDREQIDILGWLKTYIGQMCREPL